MLSARSLIGIAARAADLDEIKPMRDNYRKEMNCQIIFDSIHARAGWSREYVLEASGAAGYGSLAVGGPWRDNHALYEFHVEPGYRMRMFDLFEALLGACGTKVIETQTNDRQLSVMLHTFGRNLRADSILFEDSFQTEHVPEGAAFRAATPADVEELRRHELDDGAAWVVTMNGEVAGAGGVLYHYNRPYGDVYMKIAEPFRRKGLGSYLVQELKRACRMGGSVPAARCNVENQASRLTLQKAGFTPCGNIVTGEVG